MADLADDEMMIGAPASEGAEASRRLEGILARDEGEVLVLRLADLVPDTAGEVALYATDNMMVRLLSEEPLLDVAMTENHVTASGIDVSGHRRYRFGNGTRVYSLEALHITLL